MKDAIFLIKLFVNFNNLGIFFQNMEKILDIRI